MNCVKHGRKDLLEGAHDVRGTRIAERVRMVIQDNGVGLPENFDVRRCSSMDIRLATSFARQLGGELEFLSENGCSIQASLTRL